MSDIYLTDPRSNTFEGWIAALTIFAKYNGGMQGRVYTAAEHDIFYGPDKPEPVSAERDDGGDAACQWADDATKADAEALEAIGWHWDMDVGCWAKFT